MSEVIKEYMLDEPRRINVDPLKPSYYHTGNIDVIKYAEENFTVDERRGFYRMNVLKYVSRFHKKNGIEDLKKCRFYIDKLIELEESK